MKYRINDQSICAVTAARGASGELHFLVCRLARWSGLRPFFYEEPGAYGGRFQQLALAKRDRSSWHKWRTLRTLFAGPSTISPAKAWR